jgi:phosphoglucosamine mutase
LTINSGYRMERSLKLFGTDGVRGVAGEDLSAEMALRLGQIATRYLECDGRPRVLIGRDTRVSGQMLESSLAAGFMSMGADVHLLGIATAPAVAYLVKENRFPLGAIISASHNPIEDNGIKFFGPDGFKLPDSIEDEISRRYFSGEHQAPSTGVGVGRFIKATGLMQSYLNHLTAATGGDLKGLKVVLDCGHGAAYYAGPKAFTSLGADVISLNADSMGERINVDCGSTAPDKVAEAVMREGADLGVAFDGDADRAIFADETGSVVDGDSIIAMWADFLKEQGKLPGHAVVGTVLSNKGLEKFLDGKGISLVRADVGDKYVLREMVAGGYVLGGEQSGHIIFLDYNTTGDGVLTSLLVARLMHIKKMPLSKLANLFSRFPQVQLNLECRDKIQSEDEGRILVRPSGTEPKVRVMVESLTRDIAQDYAEQAIEILRDFTRKQELAGGGA